VSTQEHHSDAENLLGRLAKARLELAAARVLIDDIVNPPAPATIHLQRAWEQIGEALHQGAAPPPIAAAQQRLARADSGAEPLSRRELTKLVRAADTLLRGLEREHLPRRTVRRRWLWNSARVAVVVGVMAAFLWEVRGRPLPLGDGMWRGLYYPTEIFEGPPTIRHDEAIDFDWGGKAAFEHLAQDKMSIRWDTCLHLKEDATISVQIVADDGARLFVDDRKIVDGWRNGSSRPASGTLELTAGAHHLQVDYHDRRGAASIVVLTSIGGAQPAHIPSSLLRYPSDDERSPCGAD